MAKPVVILVFPAVSGDVYYNKWYVFYKTPISLKYSLCLIQIFSCGRRPSASPKICILIFIFQEKGDGQGLIVWGFKD